MSYVAWCSLAFSVLPVQHTTPIAPAPIPVIVEAWSVDGNQAGARFGSALAAAGDVNGDGFSDVIVGAPRHDDVGLDEGAAYLFLGSAAGLATPPAWSVHGGQAGALFGSAVATAGDVNGDGFSDVIVGAPGFDGGTADEGRAFVFLGSAAGLATTPSWNLLGDQAGALFGSAVATAGDVNGDGFSDVIVGAPEHDDGEANEGRAHVYLGSAAGLATTPVWTSEGNQADAHHGGSVAAAGDFDGDGRDDVLVGAADFDGLAVDGGRLQLFLGSAAGLDLSPAWSHLGAQAAEHLGASVSTAGDVHGDGFADVLAASPTYDTNLNFPDTGRIVRFKGSSAATMLLDWSYDGISQPARFSPGCRISSATFAGDVNGDGLSDLVVGLEGFDDGFTPDTGRTLLVLGGSDRPVWWADGEQGGEKLGAVVASAGDVDGDGYGDLLAGAPAFNGGGRAFLYRGASVPKLTTAWTTSGAQTGGRLGASLASGDFDADGFADLLLGHPESANNLSKEGRALAYLGSSSGPAATFDWFAEGNQSNCWFGETVAAGDVNGDGFDDALVGAPLFDGTLTDEGGLFLFLGSSSGLGLAPAWSALSGQANGEFGHSLAIAGDVNGDGRDDVLVGAPRMNRAFLFHGTPEGLTTAPVWTDLRVNTRFGESVSSAGDVNGDGFDDVLVGAPGHGNGQSNEGRALVYLGSPTGLATTFAWSYESDLAFANLGYSVASAGDVNGDGFDDVLLGTFGDRAYVHHGSASGLSALPDWTTVGARSYGRRVASTGDLNRDGFDDVMVLTPSPALGDPIVTVHQGSAVGLDLEAVWTTASWSLPSNRVTNLAPAGDVDGDGTAGILLAESLLDQGRGTIHYLEHPTQWLTRVEQRSSSGDAPIERLGRTLLDGLFTLHAEFPRNLQGFRWASPSAPTARLEWEIESLGTAFDGLDLEQGTALEPLTPPGGTVSFDELAALIDGSSGKFRDARGRPFHWRVRVRTTNPLFPCTPWLSLRDFALRKPSRRP